jgi:hypothetical protein
MAKLIKNVPVAFNLLDPDQKAMYQYVSQRTNKSSYLKRLIQRDMEGGYNVHSISQHEEQFDEELMEGLI